MASGLIGKFEFKDAMLDGIRIDAADERSWATRAEDMNGVLFKLRALRPETLALIPADRKEELKEFFLTVRDNAKTQHLQAGKALGKREQIPSGSEDVNVMGMESAMMALQAVEEEAAKLFNMLSR